MTLASSYALAWSRLASLADGDRLTLKGVTVTVSPATRLALANLLASKPSILKGSTRLALTRPAGSLTRLALVTDPSKVKFAPRG